MLRRREKDRSLRMKHQDQGGRRREVGLCRLKVG